MSHPKSLELPTTAADQVRATFADAFEGEPDVVASAPARVNLIGEHTDYNGGEVLPIAIARRTYVAARPRARRGQADGRGSVRAVSATHRERGEFDPAAPERAGGWWDYLAGVVVYLRQAGVPVEPCDIAVWSDVPAGAGLSSSAALEVATATALVSLSGATIPRRELGLLTQRAEAEFVGVACGVMDQFASALAAAGHALHVFCDTATTEQIPMREAVLIFDTAVPRSLRSSAFNTRRSECEAALRLLRERYPELTQLAHATPEQVRAAALPEPLDRRARHVAEEMRRVRLVVEALNRGEPMPGDALLASHESLRVDYECSSAELDWVVNRAMREPGVRGARLTGAGWGGWAIAVGELDALAEAGQRISAGYERAFGRQGRYWVTVAEEGARVEGS